MKKITLTLTDVQVQLIKFVTKDAYEDFNTLDNRQTENVDSEFEEITKLQQQIPIGLFRQKDGSYILIKQREIKN